MTLIFLPVLGIALYLFLGPDMRRLKNHRLFKPTRAVPSVDRPALEGGVPNAVARAATLAFRASGAEVRRGEVKPLFDGAEAFPAILDALKKADRYIHLEYFIFRDDRLGREIAGVLSAKARDGLTVKAMFDGVGSWNIGRLIHNMREAGVDARVFMPVSLPFFRSVNYRNHRKIIVVDGETAFTGGLNVGTEYMGEGRLGHWRDTHLMLRGSPVQALDEVFRRDWAAGSKGKGKGSFGPCEQANSYEQKGGAQRTPNSPNSAVQIVPGEAGAAWHAIEKMYFLMIAEARKRIWITTPYLVPCAAILEALKSSALSGVDVRILMPAKADHFLSYWAGRANIEDLLRSGVRVWRYNRGGFVHAKTLVMDSSVASVGTANLDNRSLAINFEVQAFIYDQAVCQTLADKFLSDLSASEEVDLSVWERRKVGVRVLESLGSLWSAQI
jgi:cardiolipin synthase